MRIWHYELLPYLPDLQFKGQLRELCAIMRDWRDRGTTNHILINRVTTYSKAHLYDYFLRYSTEYRNRYRKPVNAQIFKEFSDFCGSYDHGGEELFCGWHNKEYLKICMWNLYEKYKYGIGKSRITDAEWTIISNGYAEITKK